MNPWSGKRRITIVSTCLNASGCPDFALNQVEVTYEEAENGLHYYLVEADLLLAGFEEPFLHFDEWAAPSFLHPAVRQYLGLKAESFDPSILIAPEKS